MEKCRIVLLFFFKFVNNEILLGKIISSTVLLDLGILFINN